MTARFITFEGLDGSGKSTQLRLAAEDLERLGIPYLVTQEPGGTAIGERLREIFLDPDLGPMDGVLELLLVFASRRRHLSEVIDPALAAGRVVLCDRFTDSSFAYQGAGRGLEAELVARVDEIATGSRRPDRTLFFDVSPGVARERGRARSAAPDGDPDRLDRERSEFFERVRAGYLELARSDPERFVVLPADGSVKETRALVRSALADLTRPAVPAP